MTNTRASASSPASHRGQRLAVLELIGLRRWVPVAGYVAYVALLSAGYYYNLTFVQLGLIDLGRRGIGMSDAGIALTMAAFAVGALGAALAAGRAMDGRFPVSLRARVRAIAAIVAIQTMLTAYAPSIADPGLFWMWVSVGSLSIGSGIPLTFGLMADLIPIRDRGMVAAATAGIAFAAAAIYPMEWSIGDFSRVLVIGMVPAVVVLTVLSLDRVALIDRLAAESGGHGPGRFRRRDVSGWGGRWLWVVGVMFAMYFIDSLGFLRLIEEPTFVDSAWQSSEPGPRVFIAAVHLLGAAIAGVLYTNFDLRWSVMAIFGLFAFSHLLYTFHIRFSAASDPPLVMPMVYVLAVSFYTTVNFAIWPDLSTPVDIGLRTAVGVGVAGWLASFLSTATALYSEAVGVPLVEHLNLVQVMALALLFATGLVWFFGGVVDSARDARR